MLWKFLCYNKTKKGIFNMISYNPLWKTLIDKGIKKSELREMANFSTHTLSKLSKNESVSMYIIDNICQALKCNIEDVVEIIEDGTK